MDNFNIKLLNGGFNNCLPDWSSQVTNDNCYKIYFTTEGEAKLIINDQQYELKENNVYFINGYKLQEQICYSHMDVYWIHFQPYSLFFNKILDCISPVYNWKHNNQLLDNINFTHILSLFNNDDNVKNNIIKTAPLATSMYVTSCILLLISDMIENQKKKISKISFGEYEKLKPTIDFINNNYTESISLEEIAEQVYLNPTYFLRLFKKNFNITPRQYILKLRLDEACSLLKGTELSIKEISDKLGFCNQFYFTKSFKKKLSVTPSEYRKLIILP
ncbi:transcriptional regulator [Vallitalea longa]|uniref:Transcriptional regulator n=1 Tax=Vallitalea longa TaxID=2936439 RepID=A0A9W6DFB2_9FIRM|nr:AraC family transcriptional regulator [Vallitalea longa]GKX29297.1 transcriptional regulator [Vallitalea longa]